MTSPASTSPLEASSDSERLRIALVGGSADEPLRAWLAGLGYEVQLGLPAASGDGAGEPVLDLALVEVSGPESFQAVARCTRIAAHVWVTASAALVDEALQRGADDWLPPSPPRALLQRKLEALDKQRLMERLMVLAAYAAQPLSRAEAPVGAPQPSFVAVRSVVSAPSTDDLFGPQLAVTPLPVRAIISEPGMPAGTLVAAQGPMPDLLRMLPSAPLAAPIAGAVPGAVAAPVSPPQPPQVLAKIERPTTPDDAAERARQASSAVEPPALPALDDFLDACERIHLEQVLTQTHGRAREAASILGIDERSLRRKVAKHGIDRRRHRKP